MRDATSTLREMGRPADSQTGALVLLLAAYGAILLTGAREQGSLGVFLITAGAVLLFCRPRVQVSWKLWVSAAAFLAAAGSSLLPLAWTTPPAWRERWQAAAEIPVSDTITPVLLHTAWWWGLLAISVAIALFMLSRPLQPRQQLLLVNAAILLTCAYAALAIACELTGWRFPFDVQPTFGFFRNRNHTASFLVSGSVLALGVLGLPQRCGHNARRWLAGTSLVVCASALTFFSISRAGIVFLGLGTLLWLFGVHRAQARVLPVVSLLLGGLLLVIVSGGAVRQRLLGLVGLEDGAHAGSTARSEGVTDFRVLIFQDTWQIIADHPWTGTGLGTFAAIFPQYQEAALQTATAAHPENDWLMLAAEAGLPAVTFLAILTGVACWPLRKLRSDDFWSLRWGMFCAAAVAVLHGFVDVPAHRVPLGWWILLLGSASLAGSTTHTPARWPQQAVLILAGCAALTMGSTLVRAEWFQGTPATPFAGVAAHEDIARLASAQQMEDAIETAETAIDRSPLSDGLYFQLGGLLLATSDVPDDVERLFAAQRLLQPKWPEVPARQGSAWLGTDNARTLPLWQDAIARQLAIDARTRGNDAVGLYRRLLTEAGNQPDVLRGMLSPYSSLELLWIWLATVPAEILNDGVQDLAGEARFLERLSAAERERFVQQWAKRGNVDMLRVFLAKAAGWEGAAWPLLLRDALDRGNFEQAVHIAAERFGISLQLPSRATTARPSPTSLIPGDEFAQLWAVGREITARARLVEATKVAGAPAELHRWQAALAAHDRAWPAAWEHVQNYLRATNREVW